MEPLLQKLDSVSELLLSDVGALDGIGAYYRRVLLQYNIKIVSDLIWLIPSKNVSVPVLNTVSLGNQSNIAVNLIIKSVSNKTKPRKMTLANCTDLSGNKVLVIFFSNSKLFYPGSKLCIFGSVKLFNNNLSCTHPKWEPGHKEKYIELEYPVSSVPAGIINRCIKEVISKIKVVEWLPDTLLADKSWPNFRDALQNLHSITNAEVKEKSIQRLKFDEALAYQYGLFRAKEALEEKNYNYSINVEIDISSNVLTKFGHSLTKSQLKAWSEIHSEIQSEKRMMRLLYGDVGSGKTLVAILAMVACYRAGKQAALLAPTGILARQHFETIRSLLPDGNVILLTSKTRSKSIYDALSKENCILIGTHAILQDKIKYSSLGLLVIDEQHRFGVMQRMALDKTLKYNLLLMTATPIPRTYSLLAGGSIPISRLLDRPNKERQVEIKLTYVKQIEKIFNHLDKVISETDQNLFWVCPFILKSEKHGMDIETRFNSLKDRYGEVVGILHGKMKDAQKDEVLSKFFRRELRVLVSTTVIEVGIDIPHANTIVIENSELFGMAQLYQLVGRVGRGKDPGLCYLLYDRFTPDAKLRLSAIRDCRSGIELAEQDAYIRGFGNLLGLEQSGSNYFKILQPERDANLLLLANKMIDKIKLDKDKLPLLDQLTYFFNHLYSPWSGG